MDVGSTKKLTLKLFQLLIHKFVGRFITSLAPEKKKELSVISIVVAVPLLFPTLSYTTVGAAGKAK
jgi:hypothetical protein